MKTDPIRVLIVDNQVAASEWLAEVLRQTHGLEVETARNKTECLDRIIEAQGNFDVVLMDLRLGSEDGIEVMKKIHGLYPGIETIIITGFGNVDEGIRAINAGAINYIFKPLRDEEIVVYIRSAYERRNLRQKLELSERERDWLQGLLTVGQAVVSSLDPNEVAQKVYEQIQRLLPHMKAFYIATYDESRDEVRFLLTVDEGEKVEQLSRKLSERKNWGMTGHIIKTDNPILSHDLKADRKRYPDQEFIFNRPARAYIGYPLKYQGKIIGVISAQSYEPKAFSEGHERLLHAIANQVAANLGNALRHQHQSESMNVLSSLYTTLAEMRDTEQTLDLIVDCLYKLFNLETCCAGLFDSKQTKLSFMAERGLGQMPIRLVKAMPKDLVAQAFASNEIIELHDLNQRPDLKKQLVRADLTSMAILPLKGSKALLGVVTMGSKSPVTFTKEEKYLLRALADQAAIALERAQMQKQTQDWIEQLEALENVALNIAKQLDVEALLQTIIDSATELLGGAGGGIYLFTGKGDELELKALSGMSPSVKGGRTPAEKGITGWVVQEGEPQLVNDYYHWGKRLKIYDKYRFTAVVAAPIFCREKLIGVVAVHDTKKGREFTEAEKKLLLLFGRHAGTAIDNAKIIDERRVITEITQALAVLQYDDLLDRILDVLLKWMGSDVACALLLTDPATNTLYIKKARKYPPEVQLNTRIEIGGEKGITGIVAATGEPMIVPDVRKEPRYREGSKKGRSEIVVPLQVPVEGKSEVIGVLDAESPELYAFNEEHKSILMQAAPVIARAIENAKLFRLYKEKKEALELLHNVGSSIAASSHDYTKVLELLVKNARELLNAEACYVFVVPREGYLSLVRESGDFAKKREPLELEIKDEEGSGLTGAIAARGGYFNKHGKDLLNDRAVKNRRQPNHLHSGLCASLMSVPLKRKTGNKEELIGLIIADNKKDKNGKVSADIGFDPEMDNLMLETLASDAVTAIENAQHFALADMSQKVAKVVNSTLDLKKVLHLVLKELRKVLPFDTASIQLLFGTSLKIVAAEGFSGEEKLKVLQLSFPIIDPRFPNYKVIDEQTPHLIPDIRQRQEYSHFWTKADTYCTGRIRSWLGVPLMHEDKVIGMISIESSQEKLHTNMHRDLAVAFASQVASAIANAKRHQSWQSMMSLIEDFSRYQELPILLKNIAGDAVKADEAIAADIAIIYTYNPADNTFAPPVIAVADEPLRHPEKMSVALSPKSAVYRILNSKKRHVVKDVTKDRILYRGFARNEEIKSAAAFPLLDEGQPIGVMFINFRTPHSFTPEEIELMERFAKEAAVLIKHAYQYQAVKQGLNIKLNAALTLSGMAAWAHDLQPLTWSLRADARSLPKHLNGQQHESTRAAEILRRIDHNAGKIASLIPEAPEDFYQRKELSLEHACNRALRRYADKIQEKRIKVKIRLKDLPSVWANEGCVVQVFGHLIQNAVRFMSRGGRLNVSGYLQGNYVYVKVSDTGPGVPQEVQESLLESPFVFPSVSKRNGVGSGLKYSRLFLIVCDGDLLPPRSTSQGSTFEFYLPLSD